MSFAISDLPKVVLLAFLEVLLSADNAIVLAVLASHLPEKLQKKALYIGSLSAFFLRAIALLAIAYFIQYRWIQIFGAAYLLYLAIRHFAKKKGESATPSAGRSFWKTVLLIELFDLAFAIDSIVAGVAFISDPSHQGIFFEKLWIVYVGGMIGLMSIRYAAHLFAQLLRRFPGLHTSAYLMIGWIGIKLAYNAFPTPVSLEPLFWTVLGLLFLYGFLNRRQRHG